MDVPITQFRRDIFELANRALDGETVTVSYKGKRLRLVPEVEAGSRWEKITPLQIINPASSELDEEKMKAAMWAEIEADWDEL